MCIPNTLYLYLDLLSTLQVIVGIRTTNMNNVTVNLLRYMTEYPFWEFKMFHLIVRMHVTMLYNKFMCFFGCCRCFWFSVFFSSSTCSGCFLSGKIAHAHIIYNWIAQVFAVYSIYPMIGFFTHFFSSGCCCYLFDVTFYNPYICWMWHAI